MHDPKENAPAGGQDKRQNTKSDEASIALPGQEGEGRLTFRQFVISARYFRPEDFGLSVSYFPKGRLPLTVEQRTRYNIFRLVTSKRYREPVLFSGVNILVDWNDYGGEKGGVVLDLWNEYLAALKYFPCSLKAKRKQMRRERREGA